MTIDKMQRVLLLLMSVGLVPIALSYGVAPASTLGWLFGIEAADINTRNIFRSIMGLYIAMTILWTAGAFRRSLRLPALWSLTVFTLGIGLGRLLSLLVDGVPHPLLTIYMLLEFAVAATSWQLIRRHTD